MWYVKHIMIFSAVKFLFQLEFRSWAKKRGIWFNELMDSGLV
jgi:hypothetical protein